MLAQMFTQFIHCSDFSICNFNLTPVLTLPVVQNLSKEYKQVLNQYQFQWRDLSFMALAGGSLNESPFHTGIFDQKIVSFHYPSTPLGSGPLL
jgi:hypothetical protein